jgi:L-ascorbate metabolism protein UlaG (beta-lactamase superfamily)
MNPGNVQEKGLRDLIRWAMNREPGSWEKNDERNNRIPFQYQLTDSSARIYFVNHSTFLIQLGKYNILTDPVWSERVSPFQWIGPQRQRPPGIKFEELPEIHFVLISHNHYDHLDIPTIRRLKEKFDPVFIAPLGIPAYLLKNGIEQNKEVDWWNEIQLDENLMVACVPAQHFSGRGMFDRNKTLWAGYVIQSEFGNIYFAGDTGYGDFIHQIEKKYAPIDLAMLPIGAYLPRWFMSPIHTSPAEAVKMHQDLGAKKSVAMHFGTFPLGDDGMRQPLEDLKKAKENYQADQFLVLKEGQSILLE